MTNESLINFGSQSLTILHTRLPCSGSPLAFDLFMDHSSRLRGYSKSNFHWDIEGFPLNKVGDGVDSTRSYVRPYFSGAVSIDHACTSCRAKLVRNLRFRYACATHMDRRRLYNSEKTQGMPGTAPVWTDTLLAYEVNQRIGSATVGLFVVKSYEPLPYNEDAVVMRRETRVYTYVELTI